jgi:1-aminocyclopropane-1-carboxylate deaminase
LNSIDPLSDLSLKSNLLFEDESDIVNEAITIESFSAENVGLYIKREDLLHPDVSGNKYRKLKYNIAEAQNRGHRTILTFGGAYSNHIAAVAAAGKRFNFKTIGVIRGAEIESKIGSNPSLQFAQNKGMQLHFVSRKDYAIKEDDLYIESLRRKFGKFYLLPEGGTNALAVKGCEEILQADDSKFDYICASVGTGGTLAGLVNASKAHQTILGFSALKGTFQKEIIEKYSSKTNFEITDDYCFGGYAKIDSQLVRFINDFKENTKISLDPVYTAKMMYGIIDLLKSGYFRENSRILAVHTGGLQGITGMNLLLKKKNLPQITL